VGDFELGFLTVLAERMLIEQVVVLVDGRLQGAVRKLSFAAAKYSAELCCFVEEQPASARATAAVVTTAVNLIWQYYA